MLTSVEGFDELDMQFGDFPMAYVFCMLGILIALISERVGAGAGGGHSHVVDVDLEDHRHTVVGGSARGAASKHGSYYLLTVLLSVHSIIEGVALGVVRLFPCPSLELRSASFRLPVTHPPPLSLSYSLTLTIFPLFLPVLTERPQTIAFPPDASGNVIKLRRNKFPGPSEAILESYLLDVREMEVWVIRTPLPPPLSLSLYLHVYFPFSVSPFSPSNPLTPQPIVTVFES